MQLPDVLAAAMALSAEDRLKLVDAIAIIDDWHVDIVGKPQAGTVPQPKSRNRKAYTGEELVALHEIASRMDTDLSFGDKQQREAIAEAAKRFCRTYKAIAEKIRTIRAE